jgi:hypothetical protein
LNSHLQKRRVLHATQCKQAQRNEMESIKEYIRSIMEPILNPSFIDRKLRNALIKIAFLLFAVMARIVGVNPLIVLSEL